MQTSDKSFILKPSEIIGAGVGVYALHDIEPNTWLAIKPHGESLGVKVKEEDIPKELITYCIANDDGTWNCPPDFSHMHLVWYLNHSHSPNADKRKDGYYSLGHINAGEEITIDYNVLGEPEDKKESYYKGSRPTA